MAEGIYGRKKANKKFLVSPLLYFRVNILDEAAESGAMTVDGPGEAEDTATGCIS